MRHQKPKRRRRRRVWLGIFCWTLFAGGLIVQLFSPHLKIANRAFVIPAERFSHGKTIQPDEIVSKERRLQTLSAILAIAGALGLAILYRGVLLESAYRRPASAPDASSGIDEGDVCHRNQPKNRKEISV